MGVVVLPGVSHMQYASGDPPALVKARDLMPEVTYDAAHAAMSTAILDFVRAQTLQDPAAIKALLSAGMPLILSTRSRNLVFNEH